MQLQSKANWTRQTRFGAKILTGKQAASSQNGHIRANSLLGAKNAHPVAESILHMFLIEKTKNKLVDVI